MFFATELNLGGLLERMLMWTMWMYSCLFFRLVDL